MADDPFFISEKDYETIRNACVKFNSNYNDFQPLSSAENAMETNYNLIKSKLDNYFGGKEESIGEIYLNFVVCYDTTQRRYIIDRTNLCFLGINLERDKNQYEIMPKSLEDHIKNLNKGIKGNTTYRSFQDYITYDNILSRRYHHSGRKQLIRKRELKCIEVVFEAIQEEQRKEEIKLKDKKEEPKIEEKKEDKKEEKKEEKIGSLKHLILETLIGFNNFKLKEPKEEQRKEGIKLKDKKEEPKIEEGKEQVINEKKENRTIDQIEKYEIEEKKKEDACVTF